jgi:hypothetical protein
MNTLRVALTGYNALTDTNPDHFALFSDEEWVLVKESFHGSVMIGASTLLHVAHNLGYIPFVLVFGKLSGEKWSVLQGGSISLTTTELLIWNGDYINAHAFEYYIFHDQQV